jgi:hypothetical protein
MPQASETFLRQSGLFGPAIEHLPRICELHVQNAFIIKQVPLLCGLPVLLGTMVVASTCLLKELSVMNSVTNSVE